VDTYVDGKRDRTNPWRAACGVGLEGLVQLADRLERGVPAWQSLLVKAAALVRSRARLPGMAQQQTSLH
jgi:hypothetical protein